MAKLMCKCNYCGLKWIHEVDYDWRKDYKCPHCAETKRIETSQLTELGMDVFGYSFSKPFPPKFATIEYPRYSD